MEDTKYHQNVWNNTGYVLAGCIAQRYVVSIMGFLAVANAYTMRICLSTAITEMVVHHDRNESEVDPDACPSSSVSNNKPAPVSKNISSYITVSWDNEACLF